MISIKKVAHDPIRSATFGLELTKLGLRYHKESVMTLKESLEIQKKIKISNFLRPHPLHRQCSCSCTQTDVKSFYHVCDNTFVLSIAHCQIC